MKRSVALPGLILMMLASGCFYEMRDEMAEHNLKFANTRAALNAWSNSQNTCMGISCPHSFKEGFVAGYIAVANGGNGCPPAVPEIECCNHMWLDRCSESQKMSAWYDGYEIGVIAAKSDGMQDANRITTRIPNAANIDFSNINSSPTNNQSPSVAPDTIVPPVPSPASPSAPNPQPGYVDGPQTILGPQTNSGGYSTITPNSF